MSKAKVWAELDMFAMPAFEKWRLGPVSESVGGKVVYVSLDYKDSLFVSPIIKKEERHVGY
ncbi:hypothetical protein [Zhongshania sp.]|uniref:hypothetical protein n=1 Tax=Zhongshania sp. TaxID=1971902 RepID=UPI003568FB0E